jgi:sortase A
MTQKKIFKFCAIIMGISGLTILFSTLYPLWSYEWESAKKYPILISPLVDEETASFKFSTKDYTQASNWFEGADNQSFANDEVRFFTISIPRLKIEGAKVTVGGEDLSDSLIQFPGTALPGKIGNTVIFGHSVLPIFYNPKNYLSIFSTLYNLEKGDQAIVDFEGITYKYQIEDMFEVKPDDIQILEQNSSDSFLTLVTCTPPGDPRKPERLIVRARLVPPNLSYEDTWN